jgi:hypothetical protein
MSRKLIRGVVGVAVGLLAWTGPALAATSGAQRFTVVLHDGPDASLCTAVASGPISGVGPCVLEEHSGGIAVLHITLPNGTLNLNTLVQSGESQFDPTTCVFRFTETDTFLIAGRSGTYASATGDGTVAISGLFVMPRTATGCDESQARGVTVAQMTGTATV